MPELPDGIEVLVYKLVEERDELKRQVAELLKERDRLRHDNAKYIEFMGRDAVQREALEDLNASLERQVQDTGEAK